jgi:hypothetical protein
VPNERVVEVLEFETDDPSLKGEMRITTTLSSERGGTELVSVHEGLPPGLSPADNEAGWRDSLSSWPRSWRRGGSIVDEGVVQRRHRMLHATAGRR